MLYSSLGLELLSETLTVVEGMVVILSGIMATAYAAALWHVVRTGARPIRWLPLPR
jgi:hypothetical protein